MGTVYRAHDEMLGRDVAIKSLTCDDGLGTRERFLREAKAIGVLQHANILAIYDVGSEAGSPYLVVELASAGTLRERIKSASGPTPVSVDTARDVGVQIARALAAAHAADIIHRDVKPANILATRDASGVEVWKLADFGIARLPDSTLTMTGQFIGSPSYAAPESLREGKFGAASDVYGLAATLYEALSGAPPHGDHDMRSVIRKLDHEAPALSEKRDVPGALGAAIMAGLSRDPEKRPTAERRSHSARSRHASSADIAEAQAAGGGARDRRDRAPRLRAVEARRWEQQAFVRAPQCASRDHSRGNNAGGRAADGRRRVRQSIRRGDREGDPRADEARSRGRAAPPRQGPQEEEVERRVRALSRCRG
jgi:serine/threonine-protein kinase